MREVTGRSWRGQDARATTLTPGGLELADREKAGLVVTVRVRPSEDKLRLT